MLQTAQPTVSPGGGWPAASGRRLNREASNPVIQRGCGYLSQVLKINIIDYLRHQDPSQPPHELILSQYSHDKIVHDGILKVFDRFYYTDAVTAGDHIADVMYFNEVAAFNHLNSLQGVCIPRLIDYGCFFNGSGLEEKLRMVEKHALDGPFTITENVGSVKPDAANIDHYHAAVNSLAMLHALNTCHGDVRMQNMLVQKSGRVVFIDFGHSQVFDSQDEDDFEVLKFQDMLKLKKFFTPALSLN